MGTSQDITRREDDSGLRWYTDGNNRAMSVTTVLGFLDEDTTGLEYWKRNNQANGDDFHWSHIFWYSAPRGTLCHYHALNQFADEELWGKEERESLRQVTEGPQPSSAKECEFHDEYTDECYSCMEGALDAGASYDESDVVYSILKNQEVIETREEFSDLLENISLSDIALRDLSWFTDTFEDVRHDLGITNESVIAVENFLLDSPNNYAGQCDLLYEDPSGNVVMADLKTSSGLRQKHVLQAVAYGKAVERTDDLPDTVDRHEVIRLHPDTKTYEVHTDKAPSHTSEYDWHTSDGWFSDSYGDYDYDDIDAMYAEFESCVEAALDSIDEDT
jgi:hypothetical protein